MPVFYKIPLELNMDNLQRRIGIAGRRDIASRLKDILLELMDSFNNDRFISPAVTYGIHPAAALISQAGLFDQITETTDTVLGSLFSEAAGIAAAVVTIGPKLETQVADFFRSDEPLKGFLLDGIGSALVDSLAGEVCKLIDDEATSKGLQAGSPSSPGMFDISLKWQRKVLELASADSIGVSLTPASLMIPLKSASMIIGVGSSMEKTPGERDCIRCRIRETCSHRRG